MSIRNVAMKRSASAVGMAAVIGLLGFDGACTRKVEDKSTSQATAPTSKQEKELYRCSMHPAITSDKPGTCPICQMKLEKIEDDAGHQEGKILFYRHPMRPEITSKTPAKDEMGMDYIPIYEDAASAAGESAPVQGRASFTLSGEKQQLIGVTTTQVEVRILSYDVRASGRVAFDPELYTAIEEYRQAAISQSQMTDAGMKEQASELIASARTKLRLMGLSDAQIRTLGSAKTNPMSLLLPKGAVWVYAEVFEYEVAGLKSGLSVEVDAPSIPGKSFSGKVASISPIVNSPTRTVRVRASVPDPQGLLRPDTFVNVKIKVDLGQKLAVPENSVLHSGDRQYVFIAKEKGRFEPRAIRTGLKARDYYEVLSGLEEGETVVTAANFLIDSESRLRGVLQDAAPTGGKK